MKTTCASLAFVAVALVPAFALGQQAPAYPLPPQALSLAPPTGIGLLVTGSVFTGLAAINLITAPVCVTGAIRRDVQGACLDASLIFAGITAAIGIPLLAVGVTRHNRYVDWKAGNSVAARFTDLGVTPMRSGAALTWQTAF